MQFCQEQNLLAFDKLKAVAIVGKYVQLCLQVFKLSVGDLAHVFRSSYS